jgi:hypothetical protein
MSIGKLEIIKEWFDRNFKSFECDYPTEKAIRDAFQAVIPEYLLTSDQRSAKILNDAMGINKIVKYDSSNFNVTGIVAWTFCDNTKTIRHIYEFCQSPEAVMIREMLGINRHWFLCFEGAFDGISHTGNDYHVVKHLMDSFDEMWLSKDLCLMSIERSANIQTEMQSAA